MNTGQTPAHDNQKRADDNESGEPPSRNRPTLLILLTALLFAEAALVAGTLIWLLSQLLTVEPTSLASAVAIVVAAALAAVWVVATAIGSLRRQSWMRGSAVTWQLLQAAVAVGCFQGLYAQPWLGWALLIPAVVGILLVVSPSVTRVTRRIV